MVRNPQFAGIFYPDNPKLLAQKIDNFIKNAKVIDDKGSVKILIVPHAGIEYSGSVAGWGFRQIQNRRIDKVFLLGASHQIFFPYAAVFADEAWITPLGKVSVDTEAAEKLIDNNSILNDPNPHKNEHCLELELIFLQKILTNFKIIPMLVSDPDDTVIEILSKKLSELIDNKSLLVVSSDLSHYPPLDIAEVVDNKTIDAILTGYKNQFENKLKEIEKNYLSILDTAACGKKAISIALEVSNKLKIKKIIKIRYENSGDITGEKNRVVGYGAVGFYK
jgi:MEMO1 family protein